jgi:hypothetical protein
VPAYRRLTRWHDPCHLVACPDVAVGGGLSVLLFNVLFRLGLSSEADPDEEERARN